MAFPSSPVVTTRNVYRYLNDACGAKSPAIEDNYSVLSTAHHLLHLGPSPGSCHLSANHCKSFLVDRPAYAPAALQFILHVVARVLSKTQISSRYSQWPRTKIELLKIAFQHSSELDLEYPLASSQPSPSCQFRVFRMPFSPCSCLALPLSVHLAACTYSSALAPV